MEGPRTITMDELPLIEELAGAVVREPEGLPAVPCSALPRVFAPANAHHIWAVFDGGRPAAMVSYLLDRVAIGGCEVLAASLSTIATRPEYRGQGLASLILDGCLGSMRAEGARILFAPGDRSLFRRLGCYPGGIVWTAKLDAAETPPPGEAVLRAVSGDDNLAALWRLHAGEDPRIIRDQEQFRLAFLADAFARASGLETRAWLAQREGKPNAYAVVGVPLDGPPHGCLVEYAGDRRALAGALRTILARTGLKSIEVSIPHGDHLFLDRLRVAGGAWQARAMPGAIGILDPAGFWRDLQPSLVHSIGEASARRISVTASGDGAVCLRVGQEAMVLQDQERLVGLFFGAGERPWPDRVMPGNLQRTLSACLPLPLPWRWGLDYV
ncbi:MAG: GNAT family N-acetyltransferase [Bacteroidota bacterium]